MSHIQQRSTDRSEERTLCQLSYEVSIVVTLSDVDLPGKGIFPEVDESSGYWSTTENSMIMTNTIGGINNEKANSLLHR